MSKKRSYNYIWNKKEEKDTDSESEKESLSGIIGTLKIPNIFSSHDDKDKDGPLQNHIYFTEDVTKNSSHDLVMRIKQAEYDIKRFSLKYGLEEYPKIYLHINSYGGDLFSAFYVIDCILQSDIPIVTIIEGACASAATIISITGHERWISEYAYMLIHELRSCSWGRMTELEQEHLNNKELMRRIINHYVRFSNGKLKKSNLKNILKEDIWWSAKDAIDHGLVDKIITGNAKEIGNCVRNVRKAKKDSEEQELQESPKSSRKRQRR